MNVEQVIKNAMGRMIERIKNIEGVEVTSWEEEFERSVYDGCGTCGYGADEDSYKVFIYYTYSGCKQPVYYTHEGTFAELIRELDDGK
jgi:uncharacterized cysteine cluster protein YcgN (CxxCxxCC family)